MDTDLPKTACFRFYEELNDFLSPASRKQWIVWNFRGSPSVKFAIEALGVPHVEVDLILVNGLSVGFSHRLRDGDRISVYPVFEAFDLSPLVRLRERPLREPRFIADTHLGKLARYLRMCGFDTLYGNDYSDEEIIIIAGDEQRVILTRDRDLLKNKRALRGYCLRSEKCLDQLKEVIVRLDLKNSVKLFRRCLECNVPVVAVAKQDIIARLQPKTVRYFEEFHLCPSCRRIYWKGSHYDMMMSALGSVISEY